MAGIAQVAQRLGHSVIGCDSNVYPPMSTVLDQAGIEVLQGYRPEHLDDEIDLVVIGNVLSRGNPLVESVLDRDLPYTSGPQWLHDHVLRHRKVIAVAGTHGKTTAASMAAWILSAAEMDPGFLIGGQPGNFTRSAEIGSSDWFVIEADEYDSAFFDKRSKFVHYRPTVAVLNNLEFDHGDIFDNLKQIKRQFHHLLRIVPASGTVIANGDDRNVRDVLGMGCWSRLEFTSLGKRNRHWHAVALTADHSAFDVYHRSRKAGTVSWECIGAHNAGNALAAIAAAHRAGVPVEQACRHLGRYVPARRRLELVACSGGIHLYEDFAHHPTAIRATIEAVRTRHPGSRIVPVLDPGSNTMARGMHRDTLGRSIRLADGIIFYLPRELDWKPEEIGAEIPLFSCRSREDVLQAVKLNLTDNTVIICMGNRSFDGIPAWLGERLEELARKTVSPP